MVTIKTMKGHLRTLSVVNGLVSFCGEGRKCGVSLRKILSDYDGDQLVIFRSVYLRLFENILDYRYEKKFITIWSLSSQTDTLLLSFIVKCSTLPLLHAVTSVFLLFIRTKLLIISCNNL